MCKHINASICNNMRLKVFQCKHTTYTALTHTAAASTIAQSRRIDNNNKYNTANSNSPNEQQKKKKEHLSEQLVKLAYKNF